MSASSQIILDKDAMKNNWEFFKSYFGTDVKISSVVKGNAYGHGIEEYVPAAEDCGVNHFSVFNSGEARRVHDVASKGTTIMIMGAMDDHDLEWVIKNDIEFYVFNMYRLDKAIEEAKRQNKKAIIHVEVETGMFRTGFENGEIAIAIEKLKQDKEHLVFKGLCMHFAGAEHISNYLRLKQQKITFRRILKQFRMSGAEPEQVHTCCSAAAVRFPDMRYDMLRIGIMQYGFWPSPEIEVAYTSEEQLMNMPSPLKRVISWESSVMSIKDVPKGSYVGYGYTYLAEQDMQVAVVPIGYSHGFSRSLSNSGRVLINGHRLPVIGIVNMNCIAVDISQADEVNIGDEVIMIGTQNGRSISVASFGEMTNQLNYELLTRLPLNIPRVVTTS